MKLAQVQPTRTSIIIFPAKSFTNLKDIIQYDGEKKQPQKQLNMPSLSFVCIIFYITFTVYYYKQKREEERIQKTFSTEFATSY